VEENLDQKVFDGLMDFMIKYYEEMEYYERCAVLLNIKINERVKYKQETRKSNRVGQ
jgi:hypothetical protein